jgi:hAT family C-terminal dimerisation region
LWEIYSKVSGFDFFCYNLIFLLLIFVRYLLESFRFRFWALLKDYDKDLNPDVAPFLVATMFDPSLVALWESHYEQSASVFITYCSSLLENFSSELNLNPSTRKRSRGQSQVVESPKKKHRFTDISTKFTINSLLNPSGNPGESSSPSSPSSSSPSPLLFSEQLKSESKKYLCYITIGMEAHDFDENPLVFWKLTGQHKFPTLAQIAKIVLGQPIGTVDTERECSSAGNIITPTRNRLSNQNIQYLWSIHSNSKRSWAKKLISYLNP